jgi:hypothetical protein
MMEIQSSMVMALGEVGRSAVATGEEGVGERRWSHEESLHGIGWLVCLERLCCMYGHDVL